GGLCDQLPHGDHRDQVVLELHQEARFCVVWLVSNRAGAGVLWRLRPRRLWPLTPLGPRNTTASESKTLLSGLGYRSSPRSRKSGRRSTSRTNSLPTERRLERW